MRTFVSYLLVALLSFGLLVNEASAKRFGAGRSFGIQRSQSALFSPNKVQKSSVLGQSTKNPSRWGGVLSGLLIGGLLTSLFMGHGLASGIMSWLVIGAILFFVIGFFRKKMQPDFQSAQGQTSAFNQNSFNQSPFNKFTQSFNSSAGSSAANNASEYPVGFVPEVFLREAKVTFNRLQAAYDQKNLQDLSEFTAPEVFAEIKMQIDERGTAANKTEIITLDAELLDVSRQSGSLIASVRFTGSIKEDDEPISQLDEIWHFRQFSNSTQWVVGGIQQEVFQP